MDTSTIKVITVMIIMAITVIGTTEVLLLTQAAGIIIGQVAILVIAVTAAQGHGYGHRYYGRSGPINWHPNSSIFCHPDNPIICHPSIPIIDHPNTSISPVSPITPVSPIISQPGGGNVGAGSPISPSSPGDPGGRVIAGGVPGSHWKYGYGHGSWYYHVKQALIL
jgi:hypothetical protein